MKQLKLKNENKREILRALSLLTQIGLSMAFCIIVSFFIGRFIDSKLGTSPLFLFIFIVFGVAAAFRNLYVITKKFF